ncbi:hypothetical protein RchiOBHm_Chr1g0366941 [Rosa chinensis]|uniref:Uncharacterized protein n=1 Tax=Rosa chinensis TaxID=74649 RepID=A0A2P6SKE7_ROSCH|nr:hypothetical protein RchiOBHm_Chr1g0366941 [Rosa chinensis]
MLLLSSLGPSCDAMWPYLFHDHTARPHTYIPIHTPCPRFIRENPSRTVPHTPKQRQPLSFLLHFSSFLSILF